MFITYIYIYWALLSIIRLEWTPTRTPTSTRQKLWHTAAFTHERIYTPKLLHTDALTHRRFYTQQLLHTEAFTHRRFYTQRLSRPPSKKLSPSRVKDFWCFFTHRRVYTQKLLHTKAFPHRGFPGFRPKDKSSPQAEWRIFGVFFPRKSFYT